MDKAVGRNMRIAALDDDALQLDLFKQALHAMGHTCHTYLTGAQLLYSLQSECFDLLIVDWHLQDTTGPEVVLGATTCGAGNAHSVRDLDPHAAGDATQQHRASAG